MVFACCRAMMVALPVLLLVTPVSAQEDGPAKFGDFTPKQQCAAILMGLSAKVNSAAGMMADVEPPMPPAKLSRLEKLSDGLREAAIGLAPRAESEEPLLDERAAGLARDLYAGQTDLPLPNGWDAARTDRANQWVELAKQCSVQNGIAADFAAIAETELW